MEWTAVGPLVNGSSGVRPIVSPTNLSCLVSLFDGVGAIGGEVVVKRERGGGQLSGLTVDIILSVSVCQCWHRPQGRSHTLRDGDSNN